MDRMDVFYPFFSFLPVFFWQINSLKERSGEKKRGKGGKMAILEKNLKDIIKLDRGARRVVLYVGVSDRMAGELTVLNTYLCGHPESKIIFVDCSEKNGEKERKESEREDGEGQRLGQPEGKIIIRRGRVEDVVSNLDYGVDFAYVDGERTMSHVYLDGVQVWEKMKIGGILIFSDYEVSGEDSPRAAITKFILEYRHSVRLLFTNEQFGMMKCEASIIPGSYDLYCISYNEERILKKMLYHYRDARRIVMYDNESTDNTKRIMLDAGRTVVNFSTGGQKDNILMTWHKNTFWKQSTREVNYVIVIDTDEMIVFPNRKSISENLKEMDKQMITGSKVWGWNMTISDEDYERIPNNDDIWKYVRNGFNDPIYNKPMIFNPNLIFDTKFHWAQHGWNPVGILNFNTNRPLMLHLYHTGKEIAIKKYHSRFQRLKKSDTDNNLSTHYNVSFEQFMKNLNHDYNRSIDITRLIYNNLTFDKNINSFITQNHQSSPSVISDVIKYISHEKLDVTFVDFSANIGLFALTSLSSGAKEAYCVEPHIDLNNSLSLNLEINCTPTFIPYHIYSSIDNCLNDLSKITNNIVIKTPPYNIFKLLHLNNIKAIILETDYSPTYQNTISLMEKFGFTSLPLPYSLNFFSLGTPVDTWPDTLHNLSHILSTQNIINTSEPHDLLFISK